MKNPKSNYIGEARRIKRKRLIIRAIIAGSVILVVFFAIFFTYILNLKKDIDSEFPGSDSSVETRPSTGELTVPSEDPSGSETSEATPETTPSETTTAPESSENTGAEDTTASGDDPSSGSSDPSDPNASSETTANLLPDDWSDKEQVLFPQKYPLQTVTHTERDQAYSSLKHAVKKYIEDNSDARIGFYYINLNTNEAFGYNEAQPFVVGSSVYLPLTMLIYDDVRAGTKSMDIAVTFSKSDIPEKTNTKLGDAPDGKQFYLWQLAYLALSDGDSSAMNMLLKHTDSLKEATEAGPNEDDILVRMTRMSSSIDYTAVQNYHDYAGIQQSGKHRSSPYDLATFAKLLYWRYMSYPDVYQNMIDALGSTDRNCGVTRQIPSSATVLHRPGSNKDFHSESDVAIILGPEPVAVCVTVEAETPEKTQEIQAALGALVYNFINYCHA